MGRLSKGVSCLHDMDKISTSKPVERRPLQAHPHEGERLCVSPPAANASLVDLMDELLGRVLRTGTRSEPRQRLCEVNFCRESEWGRSRCSRRHDRSGRSGVAVHGERYKGGGGVLSPLTLPPMKRMSCAMPRSFS